MSFKGYRRTIVLDFDYKQVTKGVTEVNRQMAVLNSTFKLQAEQAKHTGNSLDQLGLKQEHLANKVKLQTDKVGILNKQLEALTSSEKRNEKAITNKTIEVNNATKALMKMQEELKDVNKEVEAQKTKLGRASAAIQDYAAKAKAAGVDMERVGGQLQKVGAVLSALGALAVKSNMDFSEEMAKVGTIADTTQVSMKELRKGALKVSSDFNIAAGQVANGLYEIISANIETADSLELLTTAAKLTKAGFTGEMTVAVDILTTLINSYKLSVQDATMLTDQLIITQKLGKTTVGELGESFGRIAGLAATAKIPIVELFAALATLTTNGIETSEAITGMVAVLSSVLKPTAEAREEAKRLRLQFNLTALQTKGLAGFLADVQEKTRGNEDSMSKLFGSVKGLNSMFIITGAGAEMFARNIELIDGASGTTAEALEALNTPAERFSASLNAVKNSLIETGGALSPILDLITAFLTIVSKVPSGVTAVVVSLGAAALIVGTIIKGIIGVIEMTKGLQMVMVGWNATAHKTLITILLIIAALTALLLLIIAITGKAGEVERVTNSMGKISQQQAAMQQQASRAAQRSYAIGTTYHPGGTALVGERGPELINLPRGSQVHTAQDTKRMASGGDTYYVNLVVDMDKVRGVQGAVDFVQGWRQANRAGVVKV